MNKEKFIKEMEKMNFRCEEINSRLYIKGYYGFNVAKINLNYKYSFNTDYPSFYSLTDEEKILLIQLVMEFLSTIEPLQEKFHYKAKYRFGEEENRYLVYNHTTKLFECIEYPGEDNKDVQFYFTDKDIEELGGDLGRILTDYYKLDKNGQKVYEFI